eukprot:GHVU01188867.1.p1 GENE.GHVU01188867.1~~GHVU01188867.1.p1  ORF type:complete len:277 (+),score=45.42 GHVU01188867.1:71-901(+)
MWRRLFCFPRAAAAVVATSAAAFVVDPWVGGARKEEENGTSTGFFSRKIGRLPTSPMEPWWRFTPQHDGQRAGRWFPFARMLADPAAASSSEEEQQTTSGVLPWSSGARRWRSLQQCESAADCGDQSGESAAELLLPARTRRTNAEETLENTAAVERKHDDDEGTTLVTPDFSKLFEKLRPSVCGVYHYRADHAGPRFRFVGSGFIYRPNGVIISAAHCFKLSASQHVKYCVRLEDGRLFPIRIIGKSDEADVAVIQIASDPSQTQLELECVNLCK